MAEFVDLVNVLWDTPPPTSEPDLGDYRSFLLSASRLVIEYDGTFSLESKNLLSSLSLSPPWQGKQLLAHFITHFPLFCLSIVCFRWI
jgi:hypothetical protein